MLIHINLVHNCNNLSKSRKFRFVNHRYEILTRTYICCTVASLFMKTSSSKLLHKDRVAYIYIHTNYY